MFHYTLPAWAQSCPPFIAEPPKRYPFRQGSLDSLCGLYAATNAICALLKTRSLASGQRVFHQVLSCATQYRSLDNLILEGTTDRLMARLLRDVAVQQYGLSMSRPFYHRRHTMDTMWEGMRRHTDAGGTVLLGDTDHWTVVHHVTDSRLVLSDSMPVGMGVRFRLRRSAAQWGFDSRYIYFLSRGQGGK